MAKIFWFILPALLTLSLATSCNSEPAPATPAPAGAVEAGLDAGFTLPVGQEAYFPGENLRIFFQDVLEDSRCPLSVNCIWEGQASYTIRISRDEEEYSLVLTEPGLGGRAEAVFMEYRIVANLEPYPEAPGGISPEGYRLRMSVGKLAPPDFTAEDQAAIYAAVIRQLYEVDHTFGKNRPDFPNLYLVYMTDDSAGGDFQAPPDSRILPEELRTEISARLADLPATVRWTNSLKAVPLEDGKSTVEGGGAVIHVGNIHRNEDGTAMTAGSIYVANLAAGGRTYILEKKNGIWQISGTTGGIWVS